MNQEEKDILERCVERFVKAHGDRHPLWALATSLGTVAAALVVEIAHDADQDYREAKRAYLASLADVFDLLIGGLPGETTQKTDESLH